MAYGLCGTIRLEGVKVGNLDIVSGVSRHRLIPLKGSGRQISVSMENK